MLSLFQSRQVNLAALVAVAAHLAAISLAVA